MDPLSHKVRPLKCRKGRKPLSEEIRSVYRLLLITLIIMGLGTTGSYLYLSSLQPAKGYILKQLQVDNETLQAEQRKLERQVIDAQSFLTIEEEVPTEMKSGNSADFSYTNTNENVARNY